MDGGGPSIGEWDGVVCWEDSMWGDTSNGETVLTGGMEWSDVRISKRGRGYLLMGTEWSEGTLGDTI